MEDTKASMEELIAKAERAAEPGTLGQVIQRADEETPGMTTTALKSAGYVYIYDTVTGERSVTNRNMLPAQLKKTRPDGSTVFTTVKPAIQPKRGTLKCLLHSDNPGRWHYDELGLPVCMKSNLTSPYQVKRHMQKRHQMEWQALEDERITEEKERERKLREALIKSASKKK